MNAIDAQLKLGAVSLSVADVNRSLDYYQSRIGLHILARENGEISLGVGETILLNLHHQPGAQIARRMTGLYHFALLLPSRFALAQTLHHLIETQTPMVGAADHLVSEALYLTDPDGHGIEIYRDRPRSQWYNAQGILEMGTLALDAEGILSERNSNTPRWDGLPVETVMGHVHLHVADLKAANHFYVEVLGFDQPRFSMQIPSAIFINAGGYHHTLGLNIWAGVGAPPPTSENARLLSFEMIFSDMDQLDHARQRLDEAGFSHQQQTQGWLVRDPSQNPILMRVE